MSKLSDKAVYLIDGLVGAVRDSFTTKSRWCRWYEHHFMDELRKYIHSLETEVTTLRAENKGIKACPFCGESPHIYAEKDQVICSDEKCLMSLTWIDVEIWNTRPIEDALQARAEKAEAMVERMIGCVDKAKGAVRSYFTLFRAPHVGSFLDEWNTLVAEWKERE